MQAKHWSRHCDGIGIYRIFYQRPHREVPPHAVRNHHMRRGHDCLPICPKSTQVRDPGRKIIDMANMGVNEQPSRTALPSPIQGSYAPSLARKAVQHFEIFLIMVAPPREEKQRSANRFCVSAIGLHCRKIDPSDPPTVARNPESFGGINRYGTPYCFHFGFAHDYLLVSSVG